MHRTARFLPLVLVLFANGCALVGGSPPERYGGGSTLTQAAREAAKDSTKKERRLDTGDRVPDWSRTDVEVGTPLTSDESEGRGSRRSTGGGDGHFVLGAVAGGGSLGGHEFEGYGLGGLDIGVTDADRWRLDLGLLIVGPNLSATSLAGQGLKNEVELAADFSGRYYLTPPHTFLGVYPIAGLRFGTLFWDYRKPVQVIADGTTKTLTDDYLNYFGLYGGLGVSLVQARHFSTGLNLTLGFRTYEENTFEGFHNDLFPTTGYSQLTYELVYKF